ncbi:shikimate dehydrogenase [Anaerostipes sp.]|uniref:shikimate dehydrogenase n=1 Tax=Anaerostipes sp. TaxID=1872530 RepID=UPI0025828D34|nr:shikimate dehydrogenase [Anaerostipes sp.]MCI5622419.1 shikimate dehydrogenase [Anaerostipes sp.]
MEARITGTTKLYGLIGSPVGHSGSPAMQNYGFQACDVDGAYLAFDIKEDQVPEFVKTMRLLNIQGCNVTMPCKTAAAQNMDELSPASELIGAVNTIVNRDGKLYGHITDGEGFVANLKDHGVEVKDKNIVIFGAGGAATAMQVQCSLDGAASITIFNPRDPFFERAEKMVEKIMAKVPECQVELYDLDAKDIMREKIDAADILVNGTLLGMKPKEDTTVIMDTSLFHEGLVVADVVYNPKETRLLREAKEHGCITVPGNGMLLWQGVASFKLFTGKEMPVEEVKAKFFSEV